MTHKDYQLIAEAMRLARPNPNELIALQNWNTVMNEIGSALKKENPRFIWLLFRNECLKP